MENNILFEEIMDLVPGIVAVIDQKLNLLKVNSKFIELFDIDPNADAGLGLNDFLTDSDIQEIKKRFVNKLNHDLTPIITVIESGKFRFDAEITVKPFKGDDAIRPRFFIYIDDISEKKRFEYELHNLLNIIDNSPSSIVVTDTTGAIEFVNNRFTQMTGYSKGEVLGKNPKILKSGTQGPEIYKDMWDTILSGSEWRGEIHNIKKNGRRER